MSAATPEARGARAAGEKFRRAVWQAHGATSDEATALAAYAASTLHDRLPDPCRYPLADAPCVEAWERYAREADEEGALAMLRRVFVQLRFPVAAGMSQDGDYLAATRYGRIPEDPAGVTGPRDAGGFRIFVHATPAGRVPVVLADAREDFEWLVQAVTHRNEPVAVPPAVGAWMIAGYNNWERIAERRRAFEAECPEDSGGQAWAAEFRALLPRKELYQDRFILLSSGGYSGVPASHMGLAEDAWRLASIQLRLEHECTHFFTRQALGTMRVSLLDELVADYCGMLSALGEFRAPLFLRFLGLEHGSHVRPGGRLASYRGVPPLPDGAFAVLPAVVRLAAEHLEDLDPSRRLGAGPGLAAKARVIIALLRVGLEGLASSAAPSLLDAALDEAERRVLS